MPRDRVACTCSWSPCTPQLRHCAPSTLHICLPGFKHAAGSHGLMSGAAGMMHCGSVVASRLN